MQQVAEVRRYWDSRLYWDTALFRISHRPATYCKKKKKTSLLPKMLLVEEADPTKTWLEIFWRLDFDELLSISLQVVNKLAFRA